MSNLIFNLRIWCIHIQIANYFQIIPMFRWFDIWIGIFIDTKKNITYIFPLPMIGIRIEGFAIKLIKNILLKMIHLYGFFNLVKNIMT